ncbi:ABC transporter substrate-binding protein [Paenibacillus sp. NAIST15-1]|uniref:ABC transporter substrate-binding protein n=1 Tax=Paenibacillus sp. NAIST15-1 TaxID=1605994 RepID=UPI00086F0A72|nr:extracellular solute-binding protein [Paenibacillus sp. NAIST15-1]GAV14325.1 hypothetical protein PBN151_4287 [Paenibacillus sp. NAIST15-1]
MKKIYIVILSFLLLIVGCTNSKEQNEQEVTLKVLAFNRDVFNQKYGNFFLATHPAYKLEVISLYELLSHDQNYYQSLERAIQKEQPDIIVISMDHYFNLSENQKLQPLNSWIKRDGFNLATIAPAIVNSLTNEQGDIYGLTPTFNASALYINNTFFNEKGIPIPNDLLTWDQIFQLAQQFQHQDKENKQYGLYTKYSENPYMMALHIGEGSGLSFFHARNKQFALNAKGWGDVFENVLNCVRTEVCFDLKSSEIKTTAKKEEAMKTSYQKNHPFLIGNIAMAVDDSTLYSALTGNNSLFKDLDWTVLPYPTSADFPTTGNGINMEEIFAIPVGAQHPEEAWELAKYINGEDYGRIFTQINPGELPARKPASNEDSRLEVFYKLDKINNNMINTLRGFPDPVLAKMDQLSQTYMADMLDEKTTVRDALDQMQRELQATLDNSNH